MLTLLQRSLAAMLLQLGVVQFGEFSLKAHRSGWSRMRISPFFINLRIIEDGGPLTHDQAVEIGYQGGQILRERVPAWYNSPPSWVAGIPRAGRPLADGVMKTFPDEKVTQLILRKQAGKESALSSSVEGNLVPRSHGFLVDDVITDSRSKEEAIAVMRANQLVTANCIVIVDREAGGADKMAKAGSPVLAVFTLTSLMQAYLDDGSITPKQHAEIMGYESYMQGYMATHLPVSG